VSKYEGRSVAPKPGETVRLEMPVQYTGELDGTLRLMRESGETGPLDRHRVHLIPLENTENEMLNSESLFEGLYIFSLVPPGRYYLVANAADAAEENARRPQPQLVTIGY